MTAYPTTRPTVLLATTSSYYPAARLVMALADAGCTVDAMCPAQHPMRLANALRHAYTYRGLAPMLSLTRAITSAQPDLIVSGDDLATHHLHQLYERERQEGKKDSQLSALIERSLGNPHSFSIVRDRSAFMDLAREAGIRVPSTQIVKNTDELKRCIVKTGLPAVLKANGTSGGDGVKIARTLAEAEDALEKLQVPPLLARAVKRALIDHDQTLVWPSIARRHHTVNLQAFVAGQEATSTVFCWNGAVLASLHFEVVNKASSAGHATVVRLIEHAEMSSAVERMVARLGLSGFCGFDFMLEAETRNAYLIEINPRATQVGHLNLGPGRDLPAAMCAALAGKAEQLTPKIAEKVTEKDTIALFPQEWIRDPQSPALQSAYHDVPWQEPALIRDCVRNREKQSGWYSRRSRKQALAEAQASAPVAAVCRAGKQEIIA
jgi:Carbamoyl-phosphate synthase L chain, ATP binding domain